MLTSKLRMSLLCVLMLALAAGMAVASPILLIGQAAGGADKIAKYSLDGTYLGDFAGGLNEISSILQAPTGDVYVTEYSGAKVDRFDINGNLLGSVDFSVDAGGGPAALAWLDGQLYVNSNVDMKVFGYNPDLTPGTYNHTWSENYGTYATALTTGPDGKIYGGLYGLCEFASWTPGEATHTTYATIPGGQSPAAGAWYDGVLYTSTYQNGVFKITGAGQVQSLFSDTNPYGITVHDGKIYVMRYAAAGASVGIYGLDGTPITSFTVSQPHAMRIALYDPVPEPSSILALAMGGFGLLGALRRSRK